MPSPNNLRAALAVLLLTGAIAGCSNPAQESPMAPVSLTQSCPENPAHAGVAPRPDTAALALLTRSEAALAPVPRARFTAWFTATPLETLLPGGGGLPAVTATRPIGALPFPEPGSRRLVCLADGGTALEEVLEHEPGARLRYIVWGYSTPAAAPIAYGVGEFRFSEADGGTAIDWRYAFVLHEDRFPGSLGALGRGLFRVAMLDTRYARFMRAGMRAILDGARRTA